MSDLPPEVIDEIFTHLPVKSLLRFRCVSKPFRALIDSPDFIKWHLDRALKSPSQRNIIVSNYSGLYSLDFDSLDIPNLLNHPGRLDLDTLDIPNLLNPSYAGIKVLGHSNGLVCLLVDESLYVGTDFFLWNPWTRVHKKIEIEFPDISYLTACGRIVYGFGYDGVSDDYKVVRIVPFLGEAKNEVKVYSVKSDSWRRVKDFPYFLRHGGVHGVLVSGALHWVVTRDGDHLITSFDIRTEEYHLIPQPEYLKMGFHMNVGELGGKLTVHCIYGMLYMDIWVMNNYGVRESWTKLFSIGQQPTDLPIFTCLRPIVYSNDGEKVLLERDGGGLFWYDLKLKVLKGIRINDVPQISMAFVCLQSLVKLPASVQKLLSVMNTVMNTGEEEKEDSRRKLSRKQLISDNFLEGQ